MTCSGRPPLKRDQRPRKMGENPSSSDRLKKIHFGRTLQITKFGEIKIVIYFILIWSKPETLPHCFVTLVLYQTCWNGQYLSSPSGQTLPLKFDKFRDEGISNLLYVSLSQRLFSFFFVCIYLLCISISLCFSTPITVGVFFVFLFIFFRVSSRNPSHFKLGTICCEFLSPT